MREIYGDVIKNASENGLDSWGFWHKTPAEIDNIMTAHNARESAVFERLDTLAWMVGAYAAQGYHVPKKYPKKPNMIQTRPRKLRKMKPQAMKEVLTGMADIINGGRNDS